MPFQMWTNVQLKNWTVQQGYKNLDKYCFCQKKKVNAATKSCKKLLRDTSSKKKWGFISVV